MEIGNQLTSDNELLSSMSLSWLNDSGFLTRLYISNAICNTCFNHTPILEKQKYVHSIHVDNLQIKKNELHLFT